MIFTNHEERFALTGDTLLIRACGRTDFQQGISIIMKSNISFCFNRVDWPTKKIIHHNKRHFNLHHRIIVRCRKKYIISFQAIQRCCTIRFTKRSSRYLMISLCSQHTTTKVKLLNKRSELV